MKKTIYDALRKLSGYIQSETGSYKRHNSQYESEGKLEIEREAGFRNLKVDLINGSEMRVKDLLAQNPQIEVAVDIGSGSGWSGAALSHLVKNVIAIEPSQAAIDISKTIYNTSEYPNITWHQGFAEEVLPKLNIDKPALFLTGCVLSHIRDKEVIKICSAINTIAPSGSVMSLAECFGDEPWHQLMWHVRTKSWWQDRFPEWHLTFHGPQVPGTKYFKGIWGVKK
jgi:SAM-dependent methyltransferase